MGISIFFKMVNPTKNFTATFDCGDTGIKNLEVRDLFVCSGDSLLQDNSTKDRVQKVLSIKGWILPHSGAVFVWSL